jgi:hypothetical protein
MPRRYRYGHGIVRIAFVRRIPDYEDITLTRSWFRFDGYRALSDVAASSDRGRCLIARFTLSDVAASSDRARCLIARFTLSDVAASSDRAL